MSIMIGIDPHKASHTAVAIDRDEHVLDEIRVRSSSTQADQFRCWADSFENRTWAVESAQGLGYLLAQQLINGLGAAKTVYGQTKGWISAFWKETGLLEATEAALWEEFLRSAHFYLESFDPEPRERDDVESLIGEIESRHDETALCTFGHGDLVLENLFVGSGRVGGVDWEFGRARQHPWVDPVHFAVHYTMWRASRAGDDAQKGFERGFYEESWLRNLNREFLAECFEEGGVPPERLSLALPATVCESSTEPRDSPRSMIPSSLVGVRSPGDACRRRQESTWRGN